MGVFDRSSGPKPSGIRMPQGARSRQRGLATEHVPNQTREHSAAVALQTAVRGLQARRSRQGQAVEQAVDALHSPAGQRAARVAKYAADKLDGRARTNNFRFARLAEWSGLNHRLPERQVKFYGSHLPVIGKYLQTPRILSQEGVHDHLEGLKRAGHVAEAESTFRQAEKGAYSLRGQAQTREDAAAIARGVTAVAATAASAAPGGSSAAKLVGGGLQAAAHHLAAGKHDASGDAFEESADGGRGGVVGSDRHMRELAGALGRAEHQAATDQRHETVGAGVRAFFGAAASATVGTVADSFLRAADVEGSATLTKRTQAQAQRGDTGAILDDLQKRSGEIAAQKSAEKVYISGVTESGQETVNYADEAAKGKDPRRRGFFGDYTRGDRSTKQEQRATAFNRMKALEALQHSLTERNAITGDSLRPSEIAEFGARPTPTPKRVQMPRRALARTKE